MSSYTQPLSTSIPHALRDVAWFAFGSAVAFFVPFLGVSVLELPHDLYYLAYFVVTLGLLAAWTRVEHVDVRGALRRQWVWSVAVGVILGVVLAFNVFNTADSTPRPHGAYFLFELAWRGVGYGIVDTLLLTAFPCLVAYRLLHGRIEGIVGRLRYTALALPLVLLITATYHAGYPQYRDDGLSRPEIGNTLISIPTFVTANPVGSVIAHVSQHVAAVTHGYESRIFNPPVTTA
jgi:hypothetical protein